MKLPFKHKDIPLVPSEQVKFLKNLELIIPNEKEAQEILAIINIVRLVPYFNYLFESNKFKLNTSFDNLIATYYLENDFRFLIFRSLEMIENPVKSHLINALASSYKGDDPLIHYSDQIYRDSQSYNYVRKRIENTNLPIHLQNRKLLSYRELINYLSFGTIVAMFTSLKDDYQSNVIKNMGFNPDVQDINLTLYNWLRSLSDIRNICAHYNPLIHALNIKFIQLNSDDWIGIKNDGMISILYIISLLLSNVDKYNPNIDKWKKAVEYFLFSEYKMFSQNQSDIYELKKFNCLHPFWLINYKSTIFNKSGVY